MPNKNLGQIDVMAAFYPPGTVFVMLPGDLRQQLGWPADRTPRIWITGMDGPPEARHVVLGLEPPDPSAA